MNIEWINFKPAWFSFRVVSDDDTFKIRGLARIAVKLAREYYDLDSISSLISYASYALGLGWRSSRNLRSTFDLYPTFRDQLKISTRLDEISWQVSTWVSKISILASKSSSITSHQLFSIMIIHVMSLIYLKWFYKVLIMKRILYLMIFGQLRYKTWLVI